MSFDLLLVTLSLMFFNLTSKSVFVIKLLISGILFLTAVNDELVARPLILGILPSTSVILESKSVFLTKPLTSGIFLSTLSILSSKALVSIENLVLVTKLLVSIVFVLSTYISAILSKAFLFTKVI